MKRYFLTGLWVGVSAFWLSGCGRSAPSSSVPAEAPLAQPPLQAPCSPGQSGGRLIISTFGDPKTFNPITGNEQSSEEIYRHLFSSLTGLDSPSQTVLPQLAYAWTNSPDGRTWIFYLRKNLRWSDGQPLNADDVVFTWNDVIYNPDIDNVVRDAFIIQGKKFVVTKLDDLTIQVQTPQVYAPFLINFGGVPILPRHVLDSAVQQKTFTSAYGVDWDPARIVGSGPFRLKSYAPAQTLLLERNPYFFEVDQKGTRLPYFDNIVYTIVPDMNALSLRFLSGESDVDDFIPPYEYDHYKTAADAGKLTLLEPGIGLETAFFWFNENTNMDQSGKPLVDPVKLKWFRDKRFRQACSYAIDRQSIVDSVYSGRAVPNYGFVTPGNRKWYDPDTMKYPHDPARALALLKEMGIEKRNGDDFLTDADGNKVEFVLNTNTGNGAREKTAVLIQNDLQKIGMQVVVQSIEFNSLVEKVDVSHEYECVLLGLGGGSTDPSDSMNVVKSSGFTHQWFPRQQTPSTPWEARLDELMDAQNCTLDDAQRHKDFNEVQSILAEEVPMIYTVTPYYYAAVRNNLANVRATALSSYRATWNIEELFFKP